MQRWRIIQPRILINHLQHHRRPHPLNLALHIRLVPGLLHRARPDNRPRLPRRRSRSRLVGRLQFLCRRLVARIDLQCAAGGNRAAVAVLRMNVLVEQIGLVTVLLVTEVLARQNPVGG